MATLDRDSARHSRLGLVDYQQNTNTGFHSRLDQRYCRATARREFALRSGLQSSFRKWSEVLPFCDRLAELASEQGVQIVDIGPEIAVRAAQLDRAHRDPFDRLIAATAIFRRATLVSADAQFDDLKSRADWPGRLW